MTVAAGFAATLVLAVGDRKSIGQRLDEFGSDARARLAPHFGKAGVPYPPRRITLIGLKEERLLQLYAPTSDGTSRFICSWPILGTSGTAGPKLREGDRQVPEGLYGIELLNPNSAFHVSLRIGYPNEFDRRQALKDHRRQLGGDIMIHGSTASVGCLAMGDPAAEEIFTLASDTGLKNIRVILAPVDFRLGKSIMLTTNLPPWTAELHAMIRKELQQFPLPEVPK